MGRKKVLYPLVGKSQYYNPTVESKPIFDRVPKSPRPVSKRGRPVAFQQYTSRQWRVLENIRVNLGLSRPMVVRNLLDPILVSVDEAMLYGKKEITISLHVRFEKWDKEKGETHEEAARKRKYVNFVQDVSEKVLLESGGWVVPEEENNPADPGESGTQGVGGAVQERD